MSLRCAISGEPLTSDNAQDVVVTPSGRLCLKRLLLTKLAENGGLDPFSDSGRPLSEDDLVSLQASAIKSDVPPPATRISSFSGTLLQLSKEYDAVLLELFDTRKALQETRRELSQALYQNDAAIRVLARLSMERDMARQEAQRFQAAAAAGAPALKDENDPAAADAPRKKPRVEEDLPLHNDIPSQDLDAMLTEWEKLHKARRANKSKVTYTLPTNWKVAESTSWHKSTCKGLTAIAQVSDRWVVTAGKDKHIMVYDSKEKALGVTFNPKCIVNHLDVVPSLGAADAVMVVAACENEARIYDSTTQELHAAADLGEMVVAISIHPTSKHCIVATKSGKLNVFRMGDVANDMKQISIFSSNDDDGSMEYSCGKMHPDGLLFALGTTTGKIHLWDLKNKHLAATMSAASEDSVTTIVFSNNGYHLATSHASGAVRVWDMRKNKMLAELNMSGDNLLKSLTGLAFHPDGKYLAYGGIGGLNVVMAKEWNVTKISDVTATGLVWGSQWIASISSQARAVTFHAGEIE